MKDSITISFIATCFKDGFDMASGAPSVAEDIISKSTGTAGRTGSNFADYLNNRGGNPGGDDAYSDLENLFKSRS